jgi:hypothetical protein
LTLAFILTLLSCLLLAPGVGAQVVINELMINEPGGDVVLEWIELFNTADTAVSLSHFRFEEGGQSTEFDINDTLSPQGFAILSRQPLGENSFESTWGNGSGVWGDQAAEDYLLLEAGFSLKNSGDSVTWHNTLTGISEVVRWSQSPPDGISWERINPHKPGTTDNFSDCRDQSGSTPGQVNSVIPPNHDLALLENSVTVDLSLNGQPLIITGQVTNLGLLTSTTSFLTLFFDRDFSGDLTEADWFDSLLIPALEQDSIHSFGIELYEEPGRKSLYLSLPADDDTTNNSTWLIFGLGEFYTELRINEFLINPSDMLDCEWIELINVAEFEVDLKGFAIGDLDRTHEITEKLVLQPQERVILCEDSLNFAGYYGGVDCDLIEPEGWGNYLNGGDIVVLANDLGQLSDTIRFTGSWPDDISWERDEDSVSGDFGNLFYRCSDYAGSTPCAQNSERPLPPDYDLVLIAESLIVEWLPGSDSVHLYAVVANQGLLVTSAVTLSIYFDRNFSGDLDDGDESHDVMVPQLGQGETSV